MQSNREQSCAITGSHSCTRNGGSSRRVAAAAVQKMHFHSSRSLLFKIKCTNICVHAQEAVAAREAAAAAAAAAAAEPLHASNEWWV
eukprot:1160980-Pelagomonas_calceolata.AAC.7